MADLATLKKNIRDTFTVNLKLQDQDILNDDESPMTITLNGPNSKAAQEVNFDLQDKVIREYKENPNQQQELDAREMDKIRKDRIASQVIGWNITLEGSVPELTPEAVLDFFNDFPLFFKQVEEAYEQESGFILA